MKPFPAEEGLSSRLARGQSRDHRQHPAVGRAAADGYLRAAAGDQDLLQISRHGHRPLSAGRRLSAGDAVGARARAGAAAAQRPDLGQPASAVHPRQRRGDVAGHARRSTEGLPIFYLQDIPPVATGGPAVREPRLYFGQAEENYVDREGQHARVRLSQGQGQRLRRLRRRRRRRHRRHGAARPLLLVLRRSQHPAHRATSPTESRILFHRNIQDRVRTIAPVPAPRPRSLYRGERRAPVLDAGRLHHQRLVSLCPAAIRRRRSTTSATRSRW